MSSEWEYRPLSDIAEINPRRPIKKGVTTPFIEMAALPVHSRDVKGITTTREFKGGGSKFQNGDTLVARITPCLENGKTAFVNCLAKGVVAHGSTEFIVLAPRNAQDAAFVYYLARSDAFREYAIARMEGTSGRQRVPNAAVADYRFPCPPVGQRIESGKLLTALDDRITLLRETNKTLESIAQAIFKSWFVDFDPVRAKMGGRQPEGMDEATAALFPDSFEESDSGLIPKGWESKPFGELLSHTIGGDWGGEIADEKNNVRVAIIRGTDIPDLMSSAGSHVPIRYTSQKKLQSRKLQNGDIVLEVSGGSKGQPTGRSLYITNGLLEQFNCPVEPASFCRLLRPVSEGIGILLAQHMSYIYGKGKTWEYQNQSTGIANFQTTHFLKTELVAVPSSDVLGLFSNIVVPLTLRTRIMQIQELSRVRDALLPRLISGRLRLLDAASELESLCQ